MNWKMIVVRLTLVLVALVLALGVIVLENPNRVERVKTIVMSWL